MIRPAHAVAAAALACAAVGCGIAPKTQRAVDPALAACIPPGTLLIAGFDLDALRASPLYSKAPAAVNAFATQFGAVSSALAAYNGKELLIAARGRFNPPPEGALMVAPNLALFGSAQQIAAGAAQYKSGRTGAPELLAKAELVAQGAQIWVAARGDTPLPLAGDAASLTRILHKADFITLTARSAAGLSVEMLASAADVNAARAIEETLRADFTLAAAGETRKPDVAAALRSIQVTRADREVRVTLSVSHYVAARLLAML